MRNPTDAHEGTLKSACSAASFRNHKQAVIVQIKSGTYQIVNVETGAYAALLNDNDQSELVNLTLGKDDDRQGSEVCSIPFSQLSYDKVTMC